MNDNTFTLEEAIESINSYISEANAYNKYMDNRRDELKKLTKKCDKYSDIIHDPSTSDSVKKAAYAKYKTARDAIDKLKKTVADSTGRKQEITTDDDRYRFSYKKRGYNGDTCRKDLHEIAREGKKTWMKDHGDDGEDKLASRKPGRFKTESVEDMISAKRLQVFEAFEAGVIDETEKSVMLDMLNIENYE